MEAFTLLLVFSLSGLSNAFHPRLILTHTVEIKYDRSEMKNKQLKYVSITGENKSENIDEESIKRRKAEQEEGSEGVTPNPVGRPVKNEKVKEESVEDVQLSSQGGSEKQKTKTEMRKRKLGAGNKRRRRAHKDMKRGTVKGKKLRKTEKIKMTKHEERLERQRKNHTAVNHTLPFSTTSAKVGQDSAIPAIFQIITQAQDPPPLHNSPVSPSITASPVPLVSSHPPTLHTQVSFQLPPPSVNTRAPTSSIHTSGVTQKSGEPQKQKGSLSEAQATTPKPENILITEESNPSRSNTSISTKIAKPVHRPNTAQSKPKNVQPTENDTQAMVKQSKTSSSFAEIHLTTAVTSLTRERQSNRGNKNKTGNKSKENEDNQGNRTLTTAAMKKEETGKLSVLLPADYCPPVCFCSGSVVQCSNKSVDKVPFGIPRNARSIFLMNNYIKSIQLDRFAEYVSLEMLELSNNWLTDGAIKGAFGRIPALKHLYLNGNRLKNVPTELPVSLEELRLDNNYLKVISGTVWSQCPGLFVLRLSNNNLGSESLPDAVLFSLRNLHTLSLDHNRLTSIPLGLPLFIKELYLKGNLIEKVQEDAFNGMPVLELLDLSANRLTNAGLKNSLNVSSLESLNLEGNRLEHVPRHLPSSLTSLNLEGNLISSIKKVDFSRLKKLELLGLARNKLFEVAPGAFRELPNLHRLDLCHNALHQVPRQLPRGLHSVALTHNKIQMVPYDAFCWGNKSLSLRGFVQLHLEENTIDVGKMDARAFRCLKGFELVHSD